MVSGRLNAGTLQVENRSSKKTPTHPSVHCTNIYHSPRLHAHISPFSKMDEYVVHTHKQTHTYIYTHTHSLVHDAAIKKHAKCLFQQHEWTC